MAREGECLAIPRCVSCVTDNPGACALCDAGYAPDAGGSVCRQTDCLFGPETVVSGCSACRSDDPRLCAKCFGQKAVSSDGRRCHGFTAAAWSGMLIGEFTVIAAIVLYVIYCVIPRKPQEAAEGPGKGSAKKA